MHRLWSPILDADVSYTEVFGTSAIDPTTGPGSGGAAVISASTACELWTRVAVRCHRVVAFAANDEESRGGFDDVVGDRLKFFDPQRPPDLGVGAACSTMRKGMFWLH